MKKHITFLAILISTFVLAQKKQTNQIAFEDKWVKNENYTMIFYRVNDTTKFEIGRIKNAIEVIKGKSILQSLIFSSKMFKSDFIDNSIYDFKTLKPLLHESSNDQRSIQIKYEDSIRCKYIATTDKKTQKHVEINDNKTNYLDSSTYQNIIRWLPLSEGYQVEFIVYNYDPNNTTGFIKVQILPVVIEDYKTKKEGVRKVFKVIETFGKLKTIHFIDKEDRRLWKQEINDGKILNIREE